MEIEQLEKKQAELREEIKPLEDEIDKVTNEINTLREKARETVRRNNRGLIRQIESAPFHEYTFIDLEKDDTFVEKVSEDDGNLHIQFGKVRGCFIGDQDSTKSAWLRDARQVLDYFGIDKKELNEIKKYL